MTAMEMELIQVPDSIEPYIGFKYLSWHQGKLWSSWGDKPWPINKPFEAECHASTEYEWRLVGGRANAPKQAENDYYDGDAVPPMPQVLPPPGMSWSWEEKPHHGAVEESCKCGIYAVDTPEGCEEYGPNPPARNGLWITTFGLFPPRGTKLLVELAIWGKVIPGTTGMRGQFAYPQVIHGSSDEAKQAAEAYGVPRVLRDHQKPKKSSKKSVSFTDSITLDTVDFSGFWTETTDTTSTPHKSQDLRLEFFKTIGAVLP